MKFLPIQALVGGLLETAGSIKDFDCSMYSDIDADLKLNFEMTSNGTVDLIQPFKKEIGRYTKIFHIGPLIISTRVKLKVKLDVTATADLNVTPHLTLKNNYEFNFNYDGQSIPNVKASFENIQKTLNTNIIGDFNLSQRLEIIPEIQILAYGLIGPAGKIINYQELEANVHIDNLEITSDLSVDLGMDYEASLDVSVFHFESTTTSFLPIEGDLIRYNIYKAPYLLEVVSGDAQNGTINTSLQNPIKFKVTDSYGNPLSSVPVFVETSTGNGSFIQEYFYTGSNGTVETLWTLGNNATQTARIYLKDGKNNIITSSDKNIVAYTSGGAGTSNPPVANFTANQTNVTEGTTINFTDNSTNTPTSWAWTFTGATQNSSTSQNPSITYNTAGTYDVTLTATNADGSDTETKIGYITVTSNTSLVSDYDGNQYNVIQIGTQFWTVENLKTTHYNNGDPIITGLTASQLNSTSDGAYAVYNDTLYGKLYNWYAIADSRGVCPIGFHSPSYYEYSGLKNYLNNNGGSLKSMSNLWLPPNSGATNSTGFSALPSGQRVDAIFQYIGNRIVLWTTTTNGGGASAFILSTGTNSISIPLSQIKRAQYSCRCIKD